MDDRTRRDLLLAREVTLARNGGATWAEIGVALGLGTGRDARKSARRRVKSLARRLNLAAQRGELG